MKNKYLVNMEGIGEHYYLLIDKDAWDYLDYSGENPCPTKLVDYMWDALKEEHDDKESMLKYYASVPPDERAPYMIEVYDHFNTISDLMKFVKKNKIKVIEEMTLAIY